jgi:hypothetical protein
MGPTVMDDIVRHFLCPNGLAVETVRCTTRSSSRGGATMYGSMWPDPDVDETDEFCRRLAHLILGVMAIGLFGLFMLWIAAELVSGISDPAVGLPNANRAAIHISTGEVQALGVGIFAAILGGSILLMSSCNNRER